MNKKEIAKLLKEKGFDVETDMVYDDKEAHYCDEMYKVNYNAEPYSNLVYSAPTIVEVVMWLYEKHEIWINVKADNNKTFRYELHKWSWNKNEQVLEKMFVILGSGFFDVESNEFKSPLEAYEAAILYCLNNLIKNGK